MLVELTARFSDCLRTFDLRLLFSIQRKAIESSYSEYNLKTISNIVITSLDSSTQSRFSVVRNSIITRSERLQFPEFYLKGTLLLICFFTIARFSTMSQNPNFPFENLYKTNTKPFPQQYQSNNSTFQNNFNYHQPASANQQPFPAQQPVYSASNNTNWMDMQAPSDMKGASIKYPSLFNQSNQQKPTHNPSYSYLQQQAQQHPQQSAVSFNAQSRQNQQQVPNPYFHQQATSQQQNGERACYGFQQKKAKG